MYERQKESLAAYYQKMTLHKDRLADDTYHKQFFDTRRQIIEEFETFYVQNPDTPLPFSKAGCILLWPNTASPWFSRKILFSLNSATGKHQKYTGVSNELILSNLALLNRIGKDIFLRCPIIPDVNTDDDHMEGIIQTANQLTHLREIHLEPYHNAGVSKWQNLGLQEFPAMLTPPDTKTMDSFARRIAAGTQKEVHVM